jgi:3-oxoacyl-[acyl-carrier protein] reductase
MEIKGSKILVTGGGRGIGRQIAFDLAQRGAEVRVCDLNEADLEGVVQEAQSQGLAVTQVKADVTVETEVADMMANFLADYGRIDVLVNNAGITADYLLVREKEGVVTKFPLEAWQAVINVNLTGTFLCGREAAAAMIKQKRGVIINFSSICRAGNMGQSNYSASKAGVDALTVVWAKELARYKIRVGAVAPGYTGTEMVRRIRPEILERIVAQIPVRRLGEMAEISHAVQFVIENDFFNGRVLEVDGAHRL